jgi:hypothetical protein
MSESKDLPFYERPDLTPYLIHLTKNTKSEDRFSAFDNLVNILRSGRILGSSKEKGFIKGPNPAACFMDVPFWSLKYILNDKNCDSKKPRYEPYGVMITKKYAYQHGCRPVLYLSNQEMTDLRIPEGEKWRVVRFDGADGKSVNWVHEREWRCKGDFHLPDDLIAVLVENIEEAERLHEKLYNQEDHLRLYRGASSR